MPEHLRQASTSSTSSSSAASTSSRASTDTRATSVRSESPAPSYQHGGTRSSAGEKAPAHLDGGHMNSGYSYKEYQRRGSIDSAQSKGDAHEVKRQEVKLSKLEQKIARHEGRIANADETITKLNKKPIWSPSDLKEMKQAKQERREAKADLSVAQNGNTFGNAFSRLSNWMRRPRAEAD